MHNNAQQFDQSQFPLYVTRRVVTQEEVRFWSHKIRFRTIS